MRFLCPSMRLMTVSMAGICRAVPAAIVDWIARAMNFQC